MTSKSLFFNRMKEDKKRRTWTIVLFVCMCLIFTAAFEIVLENTVNLFQNHTIGRNEFFNQIYNMTGRNAVPFYLMLSGVAAILFGFQGFSWLASKQKVDFYHSLPITRREGFLIRYLNGVLLFLIPLVIQLALNGFLLGIRGFLTKEIAENLMIGLVIYFLAFILMYHLVILAIMLTGHTLVAALASGTLLVYPTILRLVLTYYHSQSFMTAGETDPFNWLSHFSPVEKIVSMYWMLTADRMKSGIGALLFVVLFSVVTFGLCLWLYQIRPSESAGKALAFPKTQGVIRFCIVIPFAMILGMFFSLMTGTESTLWLYFGTILGGIFVHGFLEVLFHFDIKAMFYHKMELAGTIAIALGIISVFHFDLLGYDTYLPKEEKLKAISYQAEFNEDLQYGLRYQVDENGEVTEAYARQPEIRTEDTKYLYDMLKSHRKTIEENKKEETFKRFSVCYELKNGKKIYRNYEIGMELLKEKFAPVFMTKEFKETFYPAICLSGKNLEKLTYHTPFEMEGILEFSEIEVKELLDAYRKDIENMTLQTYLKQKKIGEVKFTFRKPGSKNLDIMTVSIYGHYKNVIQYLKTKEVVLTLPNEKYSIEEARMYAQEMTVDDTEMLSEEEAQRLTKKQIDEILPHLVALDYLQWSENRGDYHVTLILRNKKTNLLKQVEYNLDEKDLPDSWKQNKK